MMASAVLLAGTDTTRNQLAAAVEVLCAHPEQWTLLREQPKLVPLAVEETMRFAPAVKSRSPPLARCKSCRLQLPRIRPMGE